MRQGISVIIPTYNRDQFIGEAIESALNQKYNGKLEIIISDDGSTDKTLEIAGSYGKSVAILRKEKTCLSQGASGARNRGLKAASQPYICFLDSDDFYLPDHLNHIASVLDNNANLDFAFCRMLEVKEENQRMFKQWTKLHINKKDVLHPVVSGGGVVHTNIFLFRRCVFDKVGYFNESFPTGEDGDLWMRISEQFKGGFSDHYGAAYRIQHGAGQLSNNTQEVFRSCFLTIYSNAIERYFQLDLKNSYRIFSLRQRLSSCKYSNKLSNGEFSNYGLIYYANYIYLIFRYPVPFLQKTPSLFLKLFKKKKKRDWHELSHFLKDENSISQQCRKGLNSAVTLDS